MFEPSGSQLSYSKDGFGVQNMKRVQFDLEETDDTFILREQVYFDAKMVPFSYTDASMEGWPIDFYVDNKFVLSVTTDETGYARERRTHNLWGGQHTLEARTVAAEVGVSSQS